MNAAPSAAGSSARVGTPLVALGTLAAGVAAFLLATVVTTELLAARIEFSLFVGLPVGLLAGVGVAVGVAYGLRGDGRRLRAAVGLAAFGGAFLAVGVAAAVLGVPNSSALLAGVAAGTVAGVVGSLRAR